MRHLEPPIGETASACQDYPTVSSFLWQPLYHYVEPGDEANMKCKTEQL